jgi:hypothetical protein
LADFHATEFTDAGVLLCYVNCRCSVLSFRWQVMLSGDIGVDIEQDCTGRMRAK